MSLYESIQGELRKAGLVDWRFHTTMVVFCAVLGGLAHGPLAAFVRWLTPFAVGVFLGGLAAVSFYVLREGEQSSRTDKVTWDTLRDFLAPTGAWVILTLIAQFVTGGFF